MALSDEENRIGEVGNSGSSFPSSRFSFPIVAAPLSHDIDAIEAEAIEFISQGSDQWKELCPDSDPKADIKRLGLMFPSNLSSRAQVVEAIRAGLSNSIKDRSDGKFRSLKNLMFLIYFYTLPAVSRRDLSKWADANSDKDISRMSVPPSGSKKQMANFIGYLETERWYENLRFFLMKWRHLKE